MDMNENDTLPIEPERCYLCHKILLSEVLSSNDLVPMSICGDCKFLFLEDSDTLTQHTRYDSSPESIENILSQEFPDMINLGRHMQPMVSDHDHLTQSVDRLHTTHGRSRQWRRVLSDTESDGFDSVFGEVDDIFPYTVYGEDSEASVNVDDDVDSDTDTLLSQDDDDENAHGSVVGGARLHRSLATNGRNLSSDWLREVLSTEAGIGIGIGERNGIDEQVTWRDGEYPAAVSFVESLECVVVDDDEVEGLVCVICKDSVCVGSVVNRLPCLHVYHPSCIMPWLNAHNTCPLCRYELPTDGQRRPNRTRGSVVENEGDDGGGGWWWWCMVAPLVSVVSIGLMLWFGGSGSEMDNRSGRWWSFL